LPSETEIVFEDRYMPISQKTEALCRNSWSLRRAKCIVALGAALFGYFHGHAEAELVQVCEREMIRAARAYEIPLAVLYAIGLTETGRHGSLHPYALNIEGPSFFPATLAEATSRLEAARKRGAKLIDVGCMQIDFHYHGAEFRSPEAMFDPRENVTYAARFLKQLKAREGSWTLAAARYHAGPQNNPAQKRYVCQVIANMIASGFGSWTSTARTFCQ
jgi:soluble lytic murein transglycosylase-like protein